MNIDIDITDKQSYEIIELMRNYPQGHLEIKYERVFWVSVSAGPARCSPESPPFTGGTPQPQRGLAGASKRMLDTLGSIMGQPQQGR
jgi:hypothetical protein